MTTKTTPPPPPTTMPAHATRLFVDEIEDGVARVLLGDDTLSLPTILLPTGTREGDWVELSARVIPPPPQDTAARRKRLATDDPGGTIKL